MNLLSAVALHKSQLRAMIAEVGQTVTLVQPPAKTAPLTDVEKVMGVRSTGSPVEVPLVAVIQYPSSRVTGPKYSEKTLPLGLHATSDIILMVLLEDALEDTDKPLGRTIFETTQEVQVQGSKFKYDAQERTGLPPTPYILWVGLKATGS